MLNLPPAQVHTVELPISIDEAAKLLKMRRERLRQFVKDHGLGIRYGGSDARPRLRVKLSEVARAISHQRYRDRLVIIPAAHPLVKC